MACCGDGGVAMREALQGLQARFTSLIPPDHGACRLCRQRCARTYVRYGGVRVPVWKCPAGHLHPIVSF